MNYAYSKLVWSPVYQNSINIIHPVNLDEEFAKIEKLQFNSILTQYYKAGIDHRYDWDVNFREKLILTNNANIDDQESKYGYLLMLKRRSLKNSDIRVVGLVSSDLLYKTYFVLLMTRAIFMNPQISVDILQINRVFKTGTIHDIFDYYNKEYEPLSLPDPQFPLKGILRIDHMLDKEKIYELYMSGELPNELYQVLGNPQTILKKTLLQFFEKYQLIQIREYLNNPAFKYSMLPPTSHSLYNRAQNNNYELKDESIFDVIKIKLLDVYDIIIKEVLMSKPNRVLIELKNGIIDRIGEIERDKKTGEIKKNYQITKEQIKNINTFLRSYFHNPTIEEFEDPRDLVGYINEYLAGYRIYDDYMLYNQLVDRSVPSIYINSRDDPEVNILSKFYPINMTIDDLNFTSIEQYIHYGLYKHTFNLNDRDAYSKIIHNNKFIPVDELRNKYKNEYEKYKRNVIVAAIKAIVPIKFSFPFFKDILMSTKGYRLISLDPIDNPSNLTGKILEDIRDEYIESRSNIKEEEIRLDSIDQWFKDLVFKDWVSQRLNEISVIYKALITYDSFFLDKPEKVVVEAILKKIMNMEKWGEKTSCPIVNMKKPEQFFLMAQLHFSSTSTMIIIWQYISSFLCFFIKKYGGARRATTMSMFHEYIVFLSLKLSELDYLKIPRMLNDHLDNIIFTVIQAVITINISELFKDLDYDMPEWDNKLFSLTGTIILLKPTAIKEMEHDYMTFNDNLKNDDIDTMLKSFVDGDECEFNSEDVIKEYKDSLLELDDHTYDVDNIILDEENKSAKTFSEDGGWSQYNEFDSVIDNESFVRSKSEDEFDESNSEYGEDGGVSYGYSAVENYKTLNDQIKDKKLLFYIISLINKIRYSKLSPKMKKQRLNKFIMHLEG